MRLPLLMTCVALLFPAVACGGTTFSGGTPEPGTDGGNDSGKDSGKDTGPRPGIDGSTCNLVRLVLPIVTVTNAATGAAVCDAVLVDNDAGAALSSCQGLGGCTGTCDEYSVSDFGSQGQSFSVTISAPGFLATDVGGLTVETCGCQGPCAAPQHVAVNLDPVKDGGGKPPPLDAGKSACVPKPTVGAACSVENLTCEYGSDPNPECDVLIVCDGTTWTEAKGPACPSPVTCPSYAVAQAGKTCGMETQACAYPEATCICTSDPGGLPLQGGPVWSCTPTTPGCPATRPDLGTPCSPSSPADCDYGQCSGGVGLSCTNGYWERGNYACPV